MLVYVWGGSTFLCCHTEIQVADQTLYLSQSQYTDIRPTQSQHWSYNMRCLAGYLLDRAWNSSLKQWFSRILKSNIAEKHIFHGKKIDKYIFFYYEIKMMDLWMQIEGTKLTFIVTFSWLNFSKFASRMPQIAHILFSTFNIFRWWEGEAPPRNFLFFFISNSRLCRLLEYQILKITGMTRPGKRGSNPGLPLTWRTPWPLGQLSSLFYASSHSCAHAYSQTTAHTHTHTHTNYTYTQLL